MPDGSVGGGGANPDRIDACAGGCADNQICDADGGLRGTPRTCVDGCGGCDAGQCRRNTSTGAFSCVVPVNTCNGAACAGGQQACVGNQCSCLVSARSTQDTCQSESQWCRGKDCTNPRRYEQCTPGSAAACPTGEACVPLFGTGGEIAICLKDCNAGANLCDVGEQCYGPISTFPSSKICFPDGLLNDCSQNIPQDGGFDDAGAPLPTDGGFTQLSDGGFILKTVPVGNTCLTRSAAGVITDNPGAGRGNCTYAAFKVWRFGFFPIDTCLPPGTAAVGERCTRDFTAGTQATRCGTGLECAYTGGANDAGVDEGVCLKSCNANPGKPGFVSQPACGAGEACVNLYRYTDPNDNAVLGVCMKECNVFNPTTASCAPLSGNPTSCVPASADGSLSLTLNGAGICVPQQRQVANLGERCSGTDVFRGASCGNGQVCSTTSFTDPPACTAVCDLSCVPPAGGTAPARCMTQPNATCAGGKTCRRASSTTGATVGYCQ
ncbi:MAG: hypothetical protein IAE78_32230 [Myxococcus sp.]|nr:hypothetical protein [Myxococcus sp.]